MCEFCGEERKLRFADGYQFEKGVDGVQLYSCEDLNGVQLNATGYMLFNNTNGKYRPAAVHIKFCPFCGRKL